MNTRIAKFIADAGVASRRGAEQMIADGRVSVNGATVTTPAFFVDDASSVCVDGREIQRAKDIEIFAFNKPINTMTTTRDPMGRPTIYDVMPKKYRHLKYVGRLDFKTTGLLLLTNSGDVARRLTLPASEIPRTYIARVSSNTSNLDLVRRGITVDGIKYKPMKISVMENGDLRITVREGKKNEIRIALRAAGAPVKKLHRISFGNIEIGDLAPGQIRRVSQKDIDAMLKTH